LVSRRKSGGGAGRGGWQGADPRGSGGVARWRGAGEAGAGDATRKRVLMGESGVDAVLIPCLIFHV
jgi:hypothetical protein